MELFEEIRREHEFGVGTIQGVARKLGVHRRMVRQALGDAVPPARKSPEAEEAPAGAGDGIYQRGVGRRTGKPHGNSGTRVTGSTNGFGSRFLNIRLENRRCDGMLDSASARWASSDKRRSCLRATPGARRRRLTGTERSRTWMANLRSSRCFACGAWAVVERSTGPIRERTQQAFLEAHELGFRYFAGVFGLLRYDNLTSAVKKILRGYRREETERFIAFRSHWKFQAEFCTPGEGHEKGGVEGEAGYSRRNHLVPVPKAPGPGGSERAAAGRLPSRRGAQDRRPGADGG